MKRILTKLAIFSGLTLAAITLHLPHLHGG